MKGRPYVRQLFRVLCPSRPDRWCAVSGQINERVATLEARTDQHDRDLSRLSETVDRLSPRLGSLEGARKWLLGWVAGVVAIVTVAAMIWDRLASVGRAP
jgi:hypothetical protein